MTTLFQNHQTYTPANEDAKRLVAQIKRHEGCVLNNDGRHKIYDCPAGFRTIGYGYNIDANPVPRSTLQDWERFGMSQEVAEQLLLRQLHDAEAALDKARGHKGYWGKLAPVRKAVLVNMAFNIGLAGLRNFRKMWAALEDGNTTKAADEMLDSKWAKQVGRRAKELATQMHNGVWDGETEATKTAKKKQRGSATTAFILWVCVGAFFFALASLT